MNRVLFTDYVVIGKDIIFFDGRSRIPGVLDVNSGMVTYINDIEGYEIEKDSVSHTICSDGKIYVLLNGGNSILVYDPKRKHCDYIEISCGETPWDNFVYLCENKKEVFIFPKYRNVVLCLDTKINMFQEIPITEIKPTCGCRVGEKVWLFPKEGKQALVFDIINKQSEVYELKMGIEDVVSCEYAGDSIYLLNRYGILYTLDGQTGFMNKRVFAKKDEGTNATVGRILVVAGKIIMFPSLGNEIKIVDLKTNKFEIYSEYPDDFIYYEDVLWAKYFGITEDETFYYLLRKSNYMLKIRKATGDFEWVKIIMPSIVDKSKALLNYGKVEYREQDYRKEDFIGLVNAINSKEQEKTMKKGYAIWNDLS